MELLMLYVFFTGAIYAAWLWDEDDKWWINAMSIVLGVVNGWYVTPILIGRVIKQIYSD